MNVWKIAALFLLCAALIEQNGYTAPLPTTIPERVALSSERLKRLDSQLAAAVSNQEVAGGVAMIIRGGEVAYLHAFGMADRENGKDMDTDSIFRIASMTKAITSIAVMMLFEEGHFLLDDPVAKYLPVFDREMQVLVANGDQYSLVPAVKAITIRHLLNHTSGISYGFLGEPHIADMYARAGISDGLTQTEGTIGEMVNNLTALPLVNQPGEQWHYGLNTDVLGYLVEVISGQTLAAFFRTRIFEPLDMSDTHFFIPANKEERLATLYTPNTNGGISRLGEDPMTIGTALFSASYHYKGPRTYFSGGAGLASTATDYGRMLQMLLNGGELGDTRLLSRKTVELMTSNQIGDLSIDPPEDPITRFSLGFSVDGGPAVSGQIGSPGVYAWGGFFNTTYWVDPDEALIAILMTQLYPNDDSDIQEKFRNLVYQTIID